MTWIRDFSENPVERARAAPIYENMTTWGSMRHRLRNALQSVLLLGAMAALAGYLGWTLFGAAGLVWAAVLGPLVVALGQGVSPRLVLRMTGASAIAPPQAPGLYRTLAALTERAGLPVPPRLYYIPTRVLNAFAAGGKREPAIAVTDGLLRAMDTREVTGILAHEISHLKSNDVWVMTLADVVGRITGLLSILGQLLLIIWVPLALVTGSGFPLLPLLVLIFAPSISALLQLALSRTREYDADIAAAELTGDPRGLASALDKLERLQGGWIERMFMSKMPRWLKTHPSTHERIRRLLELEAERAPAPAYLPEAYEPDPFFERPVILRGPKWHWHGLWY